MVLFQVGSIAITTNSLPSLLAVPIFVATGFWLSIKNKVFGVLDVALLSGVCALQLMTMLLLVNQNTSQLSIFMLCWPTLVFLLGYGAWRLSGKRPLQEWPWYRFGLLTTLQILMVDLLGALLIQPAPGKIWQLGGAGVLDALVLGPPVLTLAFYGLLDCRSLLVFCSRGCREAGRCLYGATEEDHSCSSKELPMSATKRVILAISLGLVVFVGHAGFCQKETKAKNIVSVPLAITLNDFIVTTAEKYQIKPPALVSSGEDTIAFTRKTIDGSHVEIILGSQFAEKEGLSENETNARAVIAHEFGHALLYAKDLGFPALLIIGFYIVTLATLLVAAPTKKGMLLASALLFLILAAMSLISGKNTHAAIKTMCVGTAIIGFMIAWRWNTFPACRSACGIHYPGRYSILLSGLVASAIFFLGLPLIGSFNTERELFADKIAACEVGQAPIVQVLELLHPVNRSSVEEWLLDPFHPASSLRLKSLLSLSEADLKVFCLKARNP